MEDQGFKLGEWGTFWKDEKLYRFEPDKVIVLTGGNDPRCWLKSNKKPSWRSSRTAPNNLLLWMPASTGLSMPDYRIGKNYVLEDGQVVWPFALNPGVHENLALHHLQESMPDRIFQQLMRFRERRWQMYSFLARVPGATELCDSNPSLAFMLANNWVFRKPGVKRPLRSARSLVFKKQRHILEWLGFPREESVRRILRKIDPSAVSIESMLYLRSVFGDPDLCKILSRLPSINAGVIRIITDGRYRSYFASSFYRDIAAGDYPDKTCLFDLLMLVKDAVRMIGECGVDLVSLPIGSLSSLQEIHDRLSLSEKWTQGLDKIFPDPPYPGNENIRPVRTVSALLEESVTQKNCCASYAELVHHRRYFIYKAQKPMRVTIGLGRILNAPGWYIQQIYQSHNRPVPKEVFNELREELFIRS